MSFWAQEGVTSITTNMWQLTAAELLAAYARRDLSPVEVTKEAFERIERLNPALRAYLALNVDNALTAAKSAESAWLSPGEKPALCGVPVSVKDTIEVRGMPTTYGSLAFKDNVQDDAEMVLRLRRAGAVILGKTNTPEFALLAAVRNRLGDPGANPWNLDHTCGGSSGGAGAAVAAGLGPLAIGTDSGGSVRVPAAYNGIFGLKPTYQRIPSVQKWRAAPGRSHNGPLTRTVRDSALLMDVLAGSDARDPASALAPARYLEFASGTVRGLRVAVSHSFGSAPRPVPAVLDVLEEAAQLLASLGCHVDHADPPSLEPADELEPGVWAYAGDHYAGAEAMIPNFWETRGSQLTDYARPIYEAGRRALAWHYRRIIRRNQAYANQVQEWFRNYDFLLTPVSGPAPSIAAGKPEKNPNQREFGFLVAFNTAYNPAASVPFGFDPNGLPLAVQVVGRLGDDVGVLRMSAAIEAARPWATKWPPLAMDVPA